MRRWQRRARKSAGFSLVEVLVALAVTALTLSLLIAATWGLRLAMPARETLRNQPTDYLTTRRALQAWTSTISTAGDATLSAEFQRLKMIVGPLADETTVRPYLAAFEIRQDGDAYVLTALRNRNQRGILQQLEGGERSELLRTTEPLNFTYLVDAAGFALPEWVSELPQGSPLPRAIGLEVGGDRLMVGPLVTTTSASCVARNGLASLENRSCRLR